jgi:hypothetical protein
VTVVKCSGTAGVAFQESAGSQDQRKQIGKSAKGWNFTKGKIPVDANHLSLREATEISRDI